MDNATYRAIRAETGLNWWDDESYMIYQGDFMADLEYEAEEPAK